MSRAKLAEMIEMPFGIWTRLAQEMNHVLDRVQIYTHEGAILRAKSGQPRTCPDVAGGRYTQSDSVRPEPVRCGCRLGCTKWGCILAPPGEYD